MSGELGVPDYKAEPGTIPEAQCRRLDVEDKVENDDLTSGAHIEKKSKGV